MSWRAALTKLMAMALSAMLGVAPAVAREAKPFTIEEIDQMTAQVALYPDSLRYAVLTGQDAHAPGSIRDYAKNGRTTQGHALIAWLARYGPTGGMTFVVDRDGVVHQNDLGPGTAVSARATVRYDPDASWTKVASAYSIPTGAHR